MQYAIKSAHAKLWKTSLSEEEVIERLKRGHIDENWLISPQGEPESAVTIKEFLLNPTLLGELSRERAEDLRRRWESAASSIDAKPPTASITDIGLRFLCGALLAYFLFRSFAHEAAESRDLFWLGFAGTLQKGAEALILPGAFAVVFGQIWPLIKKEKSGQ
ncbi:MAG: hypothetical protein Q7Q71_04090 [Verrucomicrobiota bacterium JB023]|nr:hypothetical protein [Verrucomicrobiota bacterium JB023]